MAVTAAIGLAAAGTAVADPGGFGDHPGRSGYRLAAAGDIACTPGETGVPPDGEANGPDNCQQAQTAALVESLHPDGVAIPGDIQYQYGRLSEFLGSFDPTWGGFKYLTYPAPGNHEWYDSPNGQGYFFDGVFENNGRAGERGKGYYAVKLTRHWHLITPNSNCTSDNPLITAPVPCDQGSAQERWLRHDLAEHRGMCIIAQWHHPYFTSGPNGGTPNDNATLSFWNDAVVLEGPIRGPIDISPERSRPRLRAICATDRRGRCGPDPRRAGVRPRDRRQEPVREREGDRAQ